MSFIFRPSDSPSAAKLGGKAGALAALQNAGVRIPPWFVLLPSAFEVCLAPRVPEQLRSAKNWEETQSLLEQAELHETVRSELVRALAELCPHQERVAVRSSAEDEDSAKLSFAGQLESFLFVLPEEVPEKVIAVWRSGFSARLFAYRREHHLGLEFRPPAVLIQRMVEPEIAGVAFGADPVSGRRGVAVVSALFGLGTALVGGEGHADTWRVDREGEIIQRDIANKRIAHGFNASAPNQLMSRTVPEVKAKLPALTDHQIRAVAELARQVGKHFSRPQDIEWAMQEGYLYLLQSRPITSLGGMIDPDGPLRIWDNSNITESYSGVTTPLTFSFARRAYEGVYRQFCRIMAVPKAAIAKHDDLFSQMLGLIRGRVYYNLLSWYRILALLPGFTVNRRFMEQMMGVKEGLPEAIVAELSGANWRDRVKDSFHLAVTILGLAANHWMLPRRIREFSHRFETALAPPQPPLEAMRPDELAAYYHGLEKQLLTRWDAPLVNDFFAMIFYGVLRRLAEKWCHDPHGTLQNSLLCGEGGMVSAEPALRVREMARMISSRSDFVGLLCDGSLTTILQAMERQPAFQRAYTDYLEKFGDRCLEELKLESISLHEDSLLLLRSIGHLARSLPKPSDASLEAPAEYDQESSSSGSGHGSVRASSSGAAERSAAEQHVSEALGRRPIRRLVFDWVLRQARARVRDRENLRFERTRLFGRVRRIFVELGRRLFALELLDDPRDVFYLEVDELLGFVEGTTTTQNLKGLANLRKLEDRAYRETEAPPHRFETRGLVQQGNTHRKNAGGLGAAGDCRKGIGCCPGVARGPARVVSDPRHVTLRPGDILVAERTDPGWILLFPAASGLLVERGSLLSHSAIVARELGLPAIVAIEGLTAWLKEGDAVELDGASGIVRKIDS